MELMVGNDARVIVVMLGVVNLKLSFRDYLSFEKYDYVPRRVRNVILVFCLDKMAYALNFNEKFYIIYFGSELVSTIPLVNSLYLIDVSSYNLQVDVALKKSK